MSSLNKDKIPQHVAIIMDGNGRWAKQQGEDRVFGHHEGVNSVREIVEIAAEVGVKYLTLYAFSTENCNRPKEEVDALMELLVATISMETPRLHKNGVRLEAIGNLKSLPEACFNELQEYVIRKLENEDIDTHFEYAIRTFERDKKDILTLFGISIEYNRKDKTYNIDEEEIEDQSVTRMIDAFSIHHALQEGNKLSPSVFLEKRKL